jgi:hypothetical protein
LASGVGRDHVRKEALKGADFEHANKFLKSLKQKSSPLVINVEREIFG